MELLVVLVILIAISGVVTMLVSNGITVKGVDGRRRDAAEIATLATMREVSETLVGASTAEPGYRQDVGGLPTRLGALIENLEGEPLYEPAKKRGWRGPYLVHSSALYGTSVEAGDNFDDDDGNPYGAATDPAILDAWGKPLILQQPDTLDARLVSAGPNRTLDTDPDIPLDGTPSDDLVQFLLASDPNL